MYTIKKIVLPRQGHKSRCPLTPFGNCGDNTLHDWKPNAGRQARPEAGAQRTLEGVAWTPWLGVIALTGGQRCAFIHLSGCPCTPPALVSFAPQLLEFRHHLSGKQLQSLAGAADVASAGVQIEGDVLDAPLLPHLGQPSAAIARRADDRAFLQVICHRGDHVPASPE